MWYVNKKKKKMRADRRILPMQLALQLCLVFTSIVQFNHLTTFILGKSLHYLHHISIRIYIFYNCRRWTGVTFLAYSHIIQISQTNGAQSMCFGIRVCAIWILSILCKDIQSKNASRGGLKRSPLNWESQAISRGCDGYSIFVRQMVLFFFSFNFHYVTVSGNMNK